MSELYEGKEIYKIKNPIFSDEISLFSLVPEMGLFFFSVDFVFQTNSRFRKLLVYNAKSLALYRIATSGQSGRLRLQATSLLYLFAKKYPSFSRRIYFYQIGARDGT